MSGTKVRSWRGRDGKGEVCIHMDCCLFVSSWKSHRTIGGVGVVKRLCKFIAAAPTFTKSYNQG